MSSNTPEKIYNWWNSALSVARFYGGISYNGAQYVIDQSQEGSPLVRADVLKKEQRTARQHHTAQPKNTKARNSDKPKRGA